MTDHDLLELAAKAYWAGEIDDVVSIEWSDADRGILYTHADNQDHNGIDRAYVWNPLTDDGDALRLAVKLQIDVKQHGYYVVAWFEGGYFGTGKIPHEGDPCAATRSAIVKAAAAIASEAKP